MSGDDGIPEALRGFLDYEPKPPATPAPEREVTRLIALPADEIAALRAKADAADRVRAMHRQTFPDAVALDQTDFCHECAMAWPCPTRRALDGPPC